MVEKTFCDFCGKDITNDAQYHSDIYNCLTEKSIVEKDLCDKCMKKLKKAFK